MPSTARDANFASKNTHQLGNLVGSWPEVKKATFRDFKKFFEKFFKNKIRIKNKKEQAFCRGSEFIVTKE